MAKIIDFEQALYDRFGQVKDFTLGMRIASYFYKKGMYDVIEEVAKQIGLAKFYSDTSTSSMLYRNLVEAIKELKG